MKRRKKPTPLAEPEWGRHRRGALLHAWRDKRGARYDYDGDWNRVAREYDRVTVCGLVDVVGHERPSRRGRRCRRCLEYTRDPRPEIAKKVAAAWPRAVTIGEIRASVGMVPDRLREALRAMEEDHQIWRSDENDVERWTARRGLVEAHGGTFGMR